MGGLNRRLETDHSSEQERATSLGRGQECSVDQQWLQRSGMADVSTQLRRVAALSDDSSCSRRAFVGGETGLARNVFQLHLLLQRRLFRIHAKPARKLRPGRSIHARKREGLWLWRSERHPGWRRPRREDAAG